MKGLYFLYLQAFEGEPRLPLGFQLISREALKIIIKNRVLLVSVLLLAFLSFPLLELATLLVQYSSLEDKIILKKSTRERGAYGQRYNSGIHYDIEKNNVLLGMLGMFLLSLYYVALITFSLGKAYSSPNAHTTKKLNLRGMSIIGRWKRSIVISFYMTITTFSFLAIFLLLRQLIRSADIGVDMYRLDFAGIVVFVVGYVYLSALWMMSMLVSVVESESSGLKAIDRAMELLIFGSRGWEAYVIEILLVVAHGVVFKMCSAITISTIAPGRDNYITECGDMRLRKNLKY